jgi:hypothetical protein
VLTETEYEAIIKKEYDTILDELTRLGWRIRKNDQWVTVEEYKASVLNNQEDHPGKGLLMQR